MRRQVDDHTDRAGRQYGRSPSSAQRRSALTPRGRLRLTGPVWAPLAVPVKTAVYPRSEPGVVVSPGVVSGFVWRTSRTCSAARRMLSLMKSLKRAMFSRRAAAGLSRPRMPTPCRPGGLGDLGDAAGTGDRRVVPDVAVDEVAFAAALVAFPADEAQIFEERD